MTDDVHPQVKAILDKMRELEVPKIHQLSTDDARVMVEEMAAARRDAYPPPDVASVETVSTGPGYGHVPVRIYRASTGRPAPVIVYYHGGGHVVGSLDSYDTTARHLALTADCTLVSVDYRMAPEHPFPAAVDDCYEATRWVVDQAASLGIDSQRLAVCGDSAGGNLAAAVAILARDSGAFAISAQVLIYPVIDYRGGNPSHEEYGVGYGPLEAESVAWFMQRYLPDPVHRGDWRACPRNAASHSGLPPALILTAECDVLHDEVVAYAAQLRDADVAVEHVDFPGMIHGFFGYLGLVDDAHRAHQTVAAFLRRIWT